MAKSELRQRKSAKKNVKDPEQQQQQSDQTAAAATTKKPDTTAAAEEEAEETLWQTLHSHPLAMVGLLILIPYSCYSLFYFLSLQRPDLVGLATLGLIVPRPAVHMTDPRKVLILGSMGSGTTRVAAALEQVFGLEISHESVQAQSYFCRDGTVSNVLGLRYLHRPLDHLFAPILLQMCRFDTVSSTSSAIHPKHYRLSNCSMRQSWSKCWARECVKFVADEWGCALPPPTTSGEGVPTKQLMCRHPPFHTVLHHVQHPMRTIRELMKKVCPTGSSSTPHPALVQLALPFVPELLESNQTKLSCLHQVSWYVVRFNEALLQARQAGLVNATYQYENTTLCDIVQQAGFLDEPSSSATIHNPNHAQLVSRCANHHNNKSVGSDNDDAATTPLPQLEQRSDQNRILPSYTWEDFRPTTDDHGFGGGDTSLVEALRGLCIDLGYDPD